MGTGPFEVSCWIPRASAEFLTVEKGLVEKALWERSPQKRPADLKCPARPVTGTASMRRLIIRTPNDHRLLLWIAEEDRL